MYKYNSGEEKLSIWNIIFSQVNIKQYIGNKFFAPGKEKTLRCPPSQPPRRWYNSLLINRHGDEKGRRWHAAMAGETTSELRSST